jgi:type IV pilus assembly protein PilP
MHGENAGTDMFSKRKNDWLIVAAACLAASALTGCTSKDDELDQFIADTEREPGGRVEPLPELKPYETYTYASATIRSPFMPGGSGAGPGVRPDNRRNREFLEQFSLDTLRMVGTLRMSDRTYGLVKTKDGLVHRVLPGSYMGQADGKVVEISPSKINVVELVPDGVGGYMERAASLALN